MELRGLYCDGRCNELRTYERIQDGECFYCGTRLRPPCEDSDRGELVDTFSQYDECDKAIEWLEGRYPNDLSLNDLLIPLELIPRVGLRFDDTFAPRRYFVKYSHEDFLFRRVYSDNWRGWVGPEDESIHRIRSMFEKERSQYLFLRDYDSAFEDFPQTFFEG